MVFINNFKIYKRLQIGECFDNFIWVKPTEFMISVE